MLPKIRVTQDRKDEEGTTHTYCWIHTTVSTCTAKLMELYHSMWEKYGNLGACLCSYVTGHGMGVNLQNCFEVVGSWDIPRAYRQNRGVEEASGSNFRWRHSTEFILAARSKSG
jgi:hypothetical protein